MGRPPRAGRHWAGITHRALANMVRDRIRAAGYATIRDDYFLTPNLAGMACYFITHRGTGFNCGFSLTHANDRRVSMQFHAGGTVGGVGFRDGFCAGFCVGPCGPGTMAHTASADPVAAIDAVLTEMPHNAHLFAELFGKMQDQRVGPAEAAHRVAEALVCGVVPWQRAEAAVVAALEATDRLALHGAIARVVGVAPPMAQPNLLHNLMGLICQGSE